MFLAGAFVLGCCAAFKIWLAAQEGLVWMDEVFSFEIATKSVADLLDRAALDAHPPFYYLVLKYWLGFAKSAGYIPGTLWARLLGFLCWLTLVLVVAILTRRSASAKERLYLCVVVGIAPGVMQLTHDARSYVLAILGISASFLCLGLDLAEPVASTRQRAPRWLLYVAFSALAVWSHNLAWPALGASMLAWALLTRSRGMLNRSRFVLALVSNALVVLVALPVLVNIPRQVLSVTSGGPTWMTPATFGNLTNVLLAWIPLGRDGISILRAFPFAVLLSGFAWLPVVLFVLGAKRLDKNGLVGSLAALGLWASVFFVVGTWMAARYLELPTFHGPRYSLLISGVFALAQSGCALTLLRQRKRNRRAIAVILFVPLMGASTLAAWVSIVPAYRNQAGLRQALAELPIKGEKTYYLPEEIAPMFRSTLDHFGAKPSVEICSETTGEEGRVLFLNRWRELDSPQTLLILSAIKQGLLGDTSFSRIPRLGEDFELVDFGDANWASLYREKICPRLARLGSSQARTEELELDLTRLLRSSGWSYLEFDRRLQPFRWTDAPVAAIRYFGPLEKGSYKLHVEGRALSAGELSIELSGHSGVAVAPFDEGDLELSLPFRVNADGETLLNVRIRSSLVEKPASGYSRRIGVQVRRAVVARVSPP